MRVLGASIAGLLLLFLAAPASGDNTPPFRNGADALKVLKKNVGGALELERSAEALAKAGQEREAKSELRNSVKLLNASRPAAEWMNDPFREPDDPWTMFSNRVVDVIESDLEAINAETDAAFKRNLAVAVARKTAIYKQVAHELSVVTCGVLTDDQGPVKVNGVAQTEEQVTVEVSCKSVIDKIDIEFPSTSITQAQPENGANTVKQNGKILQEKPAAGARHDGETIVTEDPVSGERIEIVVIHGDSADYFDEVM